MLSIRERYWRYSLYVLILGLGVVIFVELIPFLGGLLGAATIYVLLRGQMWTLVERRGWRRSFAATLLLGEAVLCFLVPLSLMLWLLGLQLQDLSLDPRTLVGPLKHFALLLRERTGYDLWQETSLTSLIDYVPRVGQWLFASLADLAVNMVVLLFVLYFMLLGGCRMEEYVRELLPFNRETASGVMHEVRLIVRSNAIGIPLLAVVQGVVAYVGYLLFDAPTPLFWGMLTCFATVIPLVGTALVWLPLSAYMMLVGDWETGVGLLIYGGFVVTQIDNLVRMVILKRMTDTHPLVTIFGVIIGLSLFGFMGIIFGPLMLAIFIFCVDRFRRQLKIKKS